jgi:hypothetical protein
MNKCFDPEVKSRPSAAFVSHQLSIFKDLPADGLFLDEKNDAVAKWLSTINMGVYSSRIIRYG